MEYILKRDQLEQNVWQNMKEFYRPCPIGYRAPNQRELMLMYTTYPDLMTGFTYLTNTTFSGRNTDIGQGAGTTPDRKEAFAYTSGTLQLTTGWGSGKVRLRTRCDQ